MHGNFIEKLRSKYPELTNYDIRLCALYSMNVSAREISELMAISMDSVKKARHRLRKKLELNPQDDLLVFLSEIKGI